MPMGVVNFEMHSHSFYEIHLDAFEDVFRYNFSY